MVRNHDSFVNVSVVASLWKSVLSQKGMAHVFWQSVEWFGFWVLTSQLGVGRNGKEP